jgi:hypothetical protein
MPQNGMMMMMMIIITIIIIITIAVLPVKVDGNEPFSCRRVIQFIAALSLQIALKVHL